MTTADEQVVREERRQLGRHAVGEVTLAAGASPHAVDQRAAAGRAWLAIASGLLDAGDTEAAYRAASTGIDELGQAYLDEGVEDDTTLKLAAAEDGHNTGESYAASAMARVLETRLAMYVEAQQGRAR